MNMCSIASPSDPPGSWPVPAAYGGAMVDEGRGGAPEYAGRSFVGTPATAPGPLGPQMLRHFGAIRSNPLAVPRPDLARVRRRRPVPHPASAQLPRQRSRRRAPGPGGERPQLREVDDPVPIPRARDRGGPPRRRHRALAPSAAAGPARLPPPDAGAHRLARLRRDRATARRWEGLEAGAVVDVDEAMMHAALEVVGHALFGTDLSADAERLASATLSALDVVIARARVPITPPAWVPTPGNIKLRRSVRELDAAVGRMMDERRSAPSAAPVGHARPADGIEGRRRGRPRRRGDPRPGGDLHRRRARDGGERAHVGVGTAGRASAGAATAAGRVGRGARRPARDVRRLPATALREGRPRRGPAAVPAGLADHAKGGDARRARLACDPGVGADHPEPVAAAPASRDVDTPRGVPAGAVPGRRGRSHGFHPLRGRAEAVHRARLRLPRGGAHAVGHRRSIHAGVPGGSGACRWPSHW